MVSAYMTKYKVRIAGLTMIMDRKFDGGRALKSTAPGLQVYGEIRCAA